MKLNKIFEKWPLGTVATSKWLVQMGLSRQLIHVYSTSGTLKKLSNGCYKKPNDHIDWTGALYAIQKQLHLPIYPRGYTVLDIHGFRHHVVVREQKTIFLSGAPAIVLPRWLLRVNFGSNILYKTSHIFQKQMFFSDKEFNEYSITIPSIEQAIFEILDDVNDAHSFEDAANIMEGFLNLDIDKIKKLFKSCVSYKVKRLFVYLAKYYALPIFHELKYSNRDFGSGVLQIVQDGKFDSEFKITVPKQFKDSKENPF